MKTLTIEEAPIRTFATKEEAQAEAKRIRETPRAGDAWALFYGHLDAYVVEVRPKAKPYCNPALLRTNGTAAYYPISGITR